MTNVNDVCVCVWHTSVPNSLDEPSNQTVVPTRRTEYPYRNEQPHVLIARLVLFSFSSSLLQANQSSTEELLEQINE